MYNFDGNVFPNETVRSFSSLDYGSIDGCYLLLEWYTLILGIETSVWGKLVHRDKYMEIDEVLL